jgi:hypothetical protein
LATWRSAHAHGPEACRLSAPPTVAKRMRAHARGYCAGLEVGLPAQLYRIDCGMPLHDERGARTTIFGQGSSV